MIKNLYIKFLDLIPSKKHKVEVVCIMDFLDNGERLIQLLFNTYKDQFCLFYTKRVEQQAKVYESQGMSICSFNKKNLLNWGSIIKTVSVIVIDNYYPEIVCVQKSAVIIQIWHAIGAIKCFGWEDKKNHNRNMRTQHRFQRVYDRMDYFVVASDIMGTIFCESYKQPMSKIKVFGSPRSDLFQPKSIKNEENLVADFLYLPTYRENNKEMFYILDEVIRTFEKIPSKTFFIKMHPHYQNQFELSLPNNVVFTNDSLQNLFEQVNGVITDYSSAVFDFYLQFPKKDIVFFCPDIVLYRQSPGLQDFFSLAFDQGYINKTSQALLNSISLEGSRKKLQRVFFQQWYDTNRKNASENILEFIRQKG